MSLGDALDRAIDAAKGPGTVHAEADGASAEADVVDADRLGVRCSRVKVTRAAPFDVGTEAAGLPEKIRALPERLVPVEVDPALGGAILRTRPEDLEGGEFFELELRRARDLELRRLKGGPGLDRAPADFTLTRRQLGRLVDDLS